MEKAKVLSLSLKPRSFLPYGITQAFDSFGRPLICNPEQANQINLPEQKINLFGGIPNGIEP